MRENVEDARMTEQPKDEAKGEKTARIEELHEKLDPPEKFPVDPENARPKRSQKQPGQDLDNSLRDSDDGE